MPKRPTPFGSATLVDAREIALLLGCSPKNVRLLAEQGKLPKAVRVGRLCRWPKHAIEQWLISQT
jgi:excisionase family DNA binding protein